MAIQLYNKKTGDSIVVDNTEVKQHLQSGWTFKKPELKAKAKRKTTPKPKVEEVTQTNEEPAEIAILNIQAEAEVITTTKEN